MPSLTQALGAKYTLCALLAVVCEAISERLKPFGCSNNFPYGGGYYGGAASPWPQTFIGTITDNHDGTLTLTDSTGSPGRTTNSLCGTKIVSAECPGPLQFDLVIWGGWGPPLDPYQTVRVRIVSNTTTIMTVSPSSIFYNAVTAKYITSISSLAGK